MLYELVTGILIFTAVMSIGGAMVMVFSRRRQALRMRLEPSGVSGGAEATGRRPFIEMFGRIGTLASSGASSRSLAEYLARAGYHGRGAAAVYLGVKIFLLLLGLALPAIFLLRVDIPLQLKWLAVAACGTAMFFTPNIVVAVRRYNYREQVRGYLPDVIDLLEICVSSGMGLDTAWLRVADEIPNVAPLLADEMALTNLEVSLGASRVVAMRHMAERTGAEEVSSLAAMLVQSERFGTSIADALRTFASTMRERRSAGAQEIAEKVAVKLLFPMVLCIFPAVLVVLVGPAAIRLAKIISTG